MGCPAAAVAETVQHICIFSDPLQQQMVLLLIQKTTGLLAMTQIHLKGQTVFLHQNSIRDGPLQQFHLFCHPFHGPHRHIITGNDPRRRQQTLQCLQNQATPSVHTCRQQLQREVITVLVHHQTGEKIRFAINQPEGFHPGVEAATMGQGRSNPLLKETG